MDVEELLEITAADFRFFLPPLVDSAACQSAVLSDCVVGDCRWRCALEVIDELLCRRDSSVSGEETDLLLDLRWKLRQRAEAETALRLFCELRRRMESRHYLAFFRIRRWLENHLLAAVRICPAAAVNEVSVRLDHYCVEPIRRQCLCASLGRGAVMLAPRLQFVFRRDTPAILKARTSPAAALAGSV